MFDQPEAAKIRQIYAVIIILIIVSCSPASAAEETYRVWVSNVVDGDTVDVMIQDLSSYGYRLERVRLLGVDAPERGEPGYHEAADFVRGLILYRDVDLIVDRRSGFLERGRYGRLLGRIEVNGLDVGKWLMKFGLAVAYE